MPEEKEKADETATEEENEHEPAPEEAGDESPEDISEEECDEAIAGLLETIEQQSAELQSLRAEVAALREQHSSHERDYEHTRRPEPEQPGANVDGEPVERHWYFRKFGRD